MYPNDSSNVYHIVLIHKNGYIAFGLILRLIIVVPSFKILLFKDVDFCYPVSFSFLEWSMCIVWSLYKNEVIC